MPYGIAKRVGGDTPAAEEWMQRCIAKVQAKGHEKLAAVLICKVQYQHMKGGTNARRGRA